MTGRAVVPARPLLPALVTAGASLVVVIAVFAPWYTTQVGEIFSQGSVSGWNATAAAKIALVASTLAALASIAVAADAHDTVALSTDLVRVLVIACGICAGLAVLLVAFRTIRIPEPSEFLTRDLGLFVAMAASLVALGASIVQIVIGTHSVADTPVRGPR